MAGLRLEPGLTELLLRDAEDQPGALPLLSHALTETWQRRDAGVLTVDGYHAAGGIRGAVAASAERVYDGLDEARPLRSALGDAPPGLPVGLRRAVPDPTATRRGADDPRAAAAGPAGAQPAGDLPGRRLRAGPRGSGARLAAAARLARRGRSGAADPPASVDGGIGLGGARAPGQRALPGHPARGGRRVDRAQPRAAHGRRTSLRRGVARGCGRRATRAWSSRRGDSVSRTVGCAGSSPLRGPPRR